MPVDLGQGAEPPRFGTTNAERLPVDVIRFYPRVDDTDDGPVLRWPASYSVPPVVVDVPPDFAVRELLAVDLESTADLVDWSARYGSPSGRAPRRGPDNAAGQPRGSWTMEDQAQALRHAQQAATFVLAEVLDDPDAWDRLPADDRALFTPAGQASGWITERLGPWHPAVVLVDVPREQWISWDQAVAAQLFNYLAQRPVWHRCANAPWHLGGEPAWFTVHRTTRRARNGYGPHTRGVRFCSQRCQKAHSERERRRRLRDEKENG